MEANGNRVRTCYRDSLDSRHLQLLEAELAEEDRFDLDTEFAQLKIGLGSLLSLEAKIREKHPGREDLLIAVHAQQRGVIADIFKTAKLYRDVQSAGAVFTVDRVNALLDKIASFITYHVTDLRTRNNILDDMNQMSVAFRRSVEQGTVTTPDMDAELMDGTVPALPESTQNLCAN